MLAHIRFRRAWKLQGHAVDEIPWRSNLGVTGSYIGIFLVICSLLATFYSGLFVGCLNRPIYFEESLTLNSPPEKLQAQKASS